jgi:hypothetical protein
MHKRPLDRLLKPHIPAPPDQTQLILELAHA